MDDAVTRAVADAEWVLVRARPLIEWYMVDIIRARPDVFFTEHVRELRLAAWQGEKSARATSRMSCPTCEVHGAFLLHSSGLQKSGWALT